MNYIDSNVFIYPILYNPETDKRAGFAKRVLVAIAEGSMPAATCSLTWDEVMWITRKNLGRKVAATEGRKLLEFPNLKIIAVDERILNGALDVTEKYDIKPRDAIHAAAAMEHDIRDMVTDDSDFDGIKEIKRVRLETF
jgi:hypothetical protein